MKKFSILFLATVAITAFGFVSYNSNNEKSSNKDTNNITVLKGAEKSGFSESNQNW